jgi:hypothetical protein
MQRTRFTAAILAAMSSVVPLSAPASAAVTVPKGFAPASTSWLTPDHGIVLGYAKCATSRWCPYLLDTTNAGRSWRRLTAPPINLPENHNHVTITFVNPSEGFASDGDELQATNDGGQHWRPVALSGLRPPLYIYKATAAAGRVFVLATAMERGEQNKVRLYSGSASAATLQPVPELVATGGRAYGDISVNGGVQVVLGADNATERYWTSPDGAHFDAQTPPCPAPGYASLAGAKQGAVVALCSGSAGSPHPGSNTKQLAVAPRPGAKFELTNDAPSSGITQSFAAASDRRATIAAEGGGVGFLYTTTNGGNTWNSKVLSERGLGLFDLDFPSERIGVVVDGLPDASDGSAVYRTTDGGETWAELSF